MLYIFVDEISMVHERFYKFLLVLKKMRSDIKFIIVGNWNQLLPVNDRETFDYKNSPALYELCDGNKLDLVKCRRSSDVLFNLCKNPLQVQRSDFDNKECVNNICFLNRTRIRVNKKNNDSEFIAKGIKKYKDRYIIIPANPFDDNSQEVKLFKGVPVISKVNNKKVDICNNDLFHVKNIDGTLIRLSYDTNKEVVISKDQFQKMFRMAYCITTHSAQGATYDFPYSIYDWHLMDKRLKYFALSRSTSEKHINIV